MKNKKAFTLLEILVVATIIALMGTVGVNSYSITSKNARDVKRKADLENVKTAIVLYNQTEGELPPVTNGWISSLIIVVDPNERSKDRKYLENVPSDPISGYRYRYITNTTPFRLCARLENSSSSDFAGTSCGSFNCNYCTNTTGEVQH